MTTKPLTFLDAYRIAVAPDLRPEARLALIAFARLQQQGRSPRYSKDEAERLAGSLGLPFQKFPLALRQLANAGLVMLTEGERIRVNLAAIRPPHATKPGESAA